jgi:acyl carrier protein
MGLDAVELVLRVEDEFAISILDDEASTVRTVGDLYRLVLCKLDASPSCLSSKAFYRTRRAIIETLQLPRRSIRPSTILDELIPERSRIKLWEEIGSRIGLAFPHLRHSRQWKDRFRIASGILAALPIIAVCIALMPTGGPSEVGGFLSILLFFAFWLLLFGALYVFLLRITPGLVFDIPYRTAGDLAMGVLAMNYDALQTGSASGANTTREFVWKKLVEIICDQLQVEPEEVALDARFQEDLGVD